MDSDKVIGEVENVMDVSTVAKNVHVLLVDHNTTSLMLLAAQLDEKRYKVTTTESASFALSLLRERKGVYNIVLADYHMPEMPAIVFAHKILRRCKTTPVLLIATKVTENITADAICRGVCFFFTEPLQDCDLAGLWQHVVRATGKMPEPQNEATNYYPDIHRNENLSSGGSSSAQNGWGTNLNKNSLTRVNQRRGKNHLSEDSGDSRESDEEKESNKRPRMCWTPSLHNKFLKAIETLGESNVYPTTLLKVMSEPGLTHGQVASHLQKHREKQRIQASTQEVEELQALPPIKIPTQSLFPTANYRAAPKTPCWLNGSRPVCYSLESVKQKLDALGYSASNTLINNGGVQVQVSQGNQAGGQLAQGTGVGAQLGQGINPNSHGEQVPWFCQKFSHTGGDMITNSNPNQEQAQEFSPNFGQLTMTGNDVIPYTNPNRQQATGFPQNFGQVTMTTDNLIPNTNPNWEQPTGFPQNSAQVSMATTYMVPTGNQWVHGSNILNQEPVNDFGMGLSAFENAGTFENLGEWTNGANQQADITMEGMARDYDIGDFIHIIQDFDAASGVDPQDPFN